MSLSIFQQELSEPLFQQYKGLWRISFWFQWEADEPGEDKREASSSDED